MVDPYGDIGISAWNHTASRKWTKWFAVLAAVWITASWLVVPGIIRSAYDGATFGFLGELMGGRETHAVDHYLGYWRRYSTLALGGLAGTWLAGLILAQPMTRLVARAAYLGLPTFGGRLQRRTTALLLALAAITIVVQAGYVPGRWETAAGHEYQAVAEGLVAGEGFSFPPRARWLVMADEPGADQHGTTAWKEPVYPHFLAGSFLAFGPRYGRLVVILCQIGFFFGTCVLLYHLGCRLFGPGVGTAASLLAALNLDMHWISSGSLQIPAISGLLLVGGLLLMVRYADDPGTRPAAWLGLYLGLAALTHAVLVVLVPIAGLFILLHPRERSWNAALKPALLMGVVAALAISPWTMRNYVQFGHLIPVQTGFGLFANVTNPYVAETYMDGLDACGDGSGPAWKADGPLHAIETLRVSRNYRAIHRRGVACVAASHGEAYFTLNEHERDGLHKQEFTDFVTEHPREFLSLTAAKSLLYIFDAPIGGRGSLPLGILGVLGIAIVVRRSRMWVFPLAILAYSAPFALTGPIYYRYQAPIEPLYGLFAVVAVVTILGGPARRLKGAWEARRGEPAAGVVAGA